MKKIFTPEVKIALVAIVGIVVLFFGMQFLKGLDLFSSEHLYKIRFSNVSGLSVSNPIYANGYKVGIIKSINYDYDHPGSITVNADIAKDMRVPKGTVAVISSDLMGNVKVDLQLGDVRNGFVEPGGTIDGQLSGGAADAIKGAIPTIKALVPKIDSILTSVNTLLADPALASTLHNANKISSDLTTSTRELNTLLASLNKEVPGLANNANGLLTGARATMGNVNGMIGNANGLLANVNRKVSDIDVSGTMMRVDKTLDNMEQLTNKLNSDKGSLGLLMNDPSLYHNLNRTLSDADSLVTNLKAHPKRYVHFSLFGKKDK